MIAAGILVTRSAFLTASSILSFGFHHPSGVVDTTYSPRVPEESQHDVNNRTAAKLSPPDNHGYDAWSIWMRSHVSSFLDENPSMTGPLVRLAFHDATTYEYGPTYVNTGRTMVTGGSNGSIRYEVAQWTENRGLGRPLQAVEVMWEQGKAVSPGVSFADAVALAGAVAIEHAGGPNVAIRLGRHDSATADPKLLRMPSQKSSERSRVEQTMPSAGLDSVGLRLYFGRLGLSEEEFVALSGLHGLGRHVTLLGMPKECLKNLTRTCLEDAPVLSPFVTTSVDKYSNEYFSALLRWYDQNVVLGEVAFIPTDVALVVDDGLRRHVEKFARDEPYFSKTLSRAYQRLVDITATTKYHY